MKGLLIKDFKLMKMQKTFFIIIIVMAAVMSFSMDKLTFVIAYLCSVIPLFAISTISYDEFDNGRAFLFTLPISRKLYVIEKYCFGILLGIASLVFAVLLSLFMGKAMGLSVLSEILLSVPFAFSVTVYILSVFIPLQLKFGAEKSRFALIIVSGIIVAVGYGGIKILSRAGIDIESLALNLQSLNIWLLFAGIAVSAALVLLISIKISMKILQKKEF